MLSRSARIRVAIITVIAAVVGGLAVVAPAEAATSRSLGRTATHPYFKVTVGNVILSPAHGTLVYASVCVRKLPPGSTGGKTRVSWDPWRLTTTEGTVKVKVYDGSHPPANMFPPSVRVAKGNCAGGFLPFATARGRMTKISYGNSLGEQSTWVAPPKSADTTLGTTRSYAHLTVKVTKTMVDEYWAGAYVRTCVTSRPAGVRGSVLLTQRPWTITTNHGVITTLIMQEGAADFPGREYPWRTRVSPGTCVQGWVYFPLAYYPEQISITRVNYHNNLGNQASWATR